MYAIIFFKVVLPEFDILFSITEILHYYYYYHYHHHHHHHHHHHYHSIRLPFNSKSATDITFSRTT